MLNKKILSLIIVCMALFSSFSYGMEQKESFQFAKKTKWLYTYPLFFTIPKQASFNIFNKGKEKLINILLIDKSCDEFIKTHPNSKYLSTFMKRPKKTLIKCIGFLKTFNNVYTGMNLDIIIPKNQDFNYQDVEQYKKELLEKGTILYFYILQESYEILKKISDTIIFVYNEKTADTVRKIRYTEIVKQPTVPYVTFSYHGNIKYYEPLFSS